MDAACVAACGGMDTDAHMGDPDASLRTWTGTHQAIGDGTGCIRLPAAQQPVAEPEVNCIYLSSYARAGGPWAEERGMAGAQHRCGPKCTIRQVSSRSRAARGAPTAPPHTHTHRTHTHADRPTSLPRALAIGADAGAARRAPATRPGVRQRLEVHVQRQAAHL